jgi:TonB family protein
MRKAAILALALVAFGWAQDNSNPAPANGRGPVPRPNTIAATVIKRVEPEYTSEARTAKLDGTLTVYVDIETSGKPSNVQVIQGLGMGLDEKAIEAVKQWEFQPAMSAGMPVKSAQGVELSFRLGAENEPRVRHTSYSVQRKGRRDTILTKPVLSKYRRPEASVCADLNGSLISASFQIDEKGAPDGIHVDGPNAKLLSDAIQEWRFESARSNGSATTSTATFTFQCSPAETSAAPAEAIAIGRVSAPVPTFKPEPQYSEEARKAKWQGSVRMSLIVDAEGFAVRMAIEQMLGYGLDAMAMEAVKAWRFKPGIKDGKAVPVKAVIEVNFRLL